MVITKNDTTLYQQYLPYGIIPESCELVNRVEALEEQVDNDYQWNAKNCVCIGDSIMWYDGHELGDTDEIAVGYPTYLHDILGLTVNNQGVSGACVAYHEERHQTDNVTTVDDIDFSDYDLAVLEGGVNDYITGSPIGQLANSDFDFCSST